MNINNNFGANNMMNNNQNMGFSNREMIMNLLNQNNEMMNQITMNNNLIIQLMNNPNNINGPNNMINNMNSFNNIDYFPGNNNQRYDIIFELATGLQKIIKTPIDVKVKDLLLTFARAEKIDTNYLREKLTFIFNGMKLNLDEEKNIQACLFRDRAKILVFDISNVIGGNNEI